MNTIKFLLLSLIALLLTGCATLNYIGEDFDENNIQTIKTQEEFVFNTYKKTLDNTNFKIGISKTPVAEILALFVQVENLSYETPYVFRVEDLRIADPNKELLFITSSNYLNIFQTQEASSMAALGAMSSTLTTMTGMSTNYNDFNQTMVQNSAQETNKSAFSRIEQMGNQILNHSIKVSSTISPRKSQYFYFFFEDPGNYPIKVRYKDLSYEFNL